MPELPNRPDVIVPKGQVFDHVVVVTKYPAFVEYLRSRGFVNETCLVNPNPKPEELRGARVFTNDIPITLACFAISVTIIPLDIPEEFDIQEIPFSVIERYAQAPRTFYVSGSAEAIDNLNSDGLTPLAISCAQKILTLQPTSLESAQNEVALIIDQLLWQERKASVDTERLLVRVIRALNDRNEKILSQRAATRGMATVFSPDVLASERSR